MQKKNGHFIGRKLDLSNSEEKEKKKKHNHNHKQTNKLKSPELKQLH